MTGMGQTAEIIDLGAYRARRSRTTLGMSPASLVTNPWVMAVPVFMPLMVAWLPVWTSANALAAAGTTDE